MKEGSIGDVSIFPEHDHDPIQKIDLFDTSKDRVGGAKNENADAQQSDEDFDFGFISSRKDKELTGEISANESEGDDLAGYEASLEGGMSEDDN